MQRPACDLCRRTGTRCEFPEKRRASSIRKLQVKTNSQEINDNLGKLLQLLEAGPESHQVLQPRRGTSLRPEDQGSPHSSIQTNEPDTQQTEPNCAPQQQNNPSAEMEKARTSVQPEQACVPLQMEESSPQSSSHALIQQQDISRPEGRQLLERPLNDEVSYDLAIHLIKVFFDRIQCWLPLLHKPSFLTFYMNRLQCGKNSLDSLAVDERLLLCCMFALSARYSNSAEFADIHPTLRGNRFSAMARVLYDQARNLQPPSITLLQGCILLSFCQYTSEFSSHGWIVVGVCVRLAYELGLSDIDDDDDDNGDSDSDSQMATSFTTLEKEERRRAWWLVWELDTFGSTVSRRPYAIDRRRMKVMLPISDEAWFSGRATSSSRLNTRPGESWKSLKGDENQDARAWFLVANHLMACTHEHMHHRRGTLENDKVILENEVSCFRLSLPSKLQLGSAQLHTDAGPSTQYNWIIGIHLMLSVTSFMLCNALVTPKYASSLMVLGQDVAGAARARILGISSIAALWPASQIEVAHPFFACLLLPVHIRGNKESVDFALSSSNRDLERLIIATFARSWGLGSCALRECLYRSEMTFINQFPGLAELLQTPGTLGVNEEDLAVRFATYFPPSKKSIYPPTAEHKIRSYSSSGSNASLQNLAKTPYYAEATGETNPESRIPPTQQGPVMRDDANFDMASMDFGNATGMEMQEFDFQFSDMFGTDNYHSDLPITHGGIPSR